MKTNEILSAIEKAKNGRYIKIIKSKDYKNGLVKITGMVARLGVNYANMKVAKDKIVGALLWGHWLENYEGLVIEHNGKLYLRVASAYSNNTTSQFFLNGGEITKEQALAMLGDKANGHKADVYNIAFENLIYIGENK